MVTPAARLAHRTGFTGCCSSKRTPFISQVFLTHRLMMPGMDPLPWDLMERLLKVTRSPGSHLNDPKCLTEERRRLPVLLCHLVARLQTACPAQSSGITLSPPSSFMNFYCYYHVITSTHGGADVPAGFSLIPENLSSVQI